MIGQRNRDGLVLGERYAMFLQLGSLLLVLLYTKKLLL
jgi:hypothetical protein